MPRYKLTIAYDGTAYHGWQKQEVPDGAGSGAGDPEAVRRDDRVILPTVQEVVEQATRQVVREPVRLTGASRTDAGVHAWGQVAAFSSEPDAERGVGWPGDRGCDRLVLAINSRLPEDIVVRDAAIVPDDFDPISQAVRKAYTYTILVSRLRPLWDRRCVFHLWRTLDAGRMAEAAKRIEGEHDFASFAAAGHGRQSTIRTVLRCSVTEECEHGPGSAKPGELATDTRRIRIEVVGTGFLYNMVRIIAGTLVEVGRGAIEPAAIPGILSARDRRRAGPTLPPEGLRLEWIVYPPLGGAVP
ncbi:MAG: tRNA pseudouridine(38-40) synthase TruA [Phycisphaeraceae bacterium]|nr:tRNA pseudouridine(38-40) synthase TruA [Phycisphaeraceae bacterium]